MSEETAKYLAQQEILSAGMRNYLIVYPNLVKYFDDVPAVPEVIVIRDKVDAVAEKYLATLKFIAGQCDGYVYWDWKVYHLPEEEERLNAAFWSRYRIYGNGKFGVVMGQPDGKAETFDPDKAIPIFAGFFSDTSKSYGQSFEDVLLLPTDGVLPYSDENYADWAEKLLRTLAILNRIGVKTQEVSFAYPIDNILRDNTVRKVTMLRRKVDTATNKLDLNSLSTQYEWHEYGTYNWHETRRTPYIYSSLVKYIGERYNSSNRLTYNSNDPRADVMVYTTLMGDVHIATICDATADDPLTLNAPDVHAVVIYTLTKDGVPNVLFYRQGKDLADTIPYTDYVAGVNCNVAEIDDQDLNDFFKMFLFSECNDIAFISDPNLGLLNEYSPRLERDTRYGTVEDTVVYQKVSMLSRQLKKDLGVKRPVQSPLSDDLYGFTDGRAIPNAVKVPVEIITAAYDDDIDPAKLIWDMLRPISKSE